MEVPFGDIPLFLEPNEQVRNYAIRASRRAAGAKVSWTTNILPLSEVSDDIMNDKFFVETIFRNHNGGTRRFSYLSGTLLYKFHSLYMCSCTSSNEFPFFDS
ncbi:hypothetical protein VPH35_088558 [Triticum aestivum]